MTNITARLAGIATLALAALPAVALTTAAHAASYVPAKVRIADLNMTSAAVRAEANEKAASEIRLAGALLRSRSRIVSGEEGLATQCDDPVHPDWRANLDRV